MRDGRMALVTAEVSFSGVGCVAQAFNLGALSSVAIREENRKRHLLPPPRTRVDEFRCIGPEGNVLRILQRYAGFICLYFL